MLAELTHTITERKRYEEEIRRQLEELRRWHAVTLGREERIGELKREVNDLLAAMGQPPRYHSQVPGVSGAERKGQAPS